ncbi:helix-turn-helix domain-containing protein [bacterium]|nr:helix-turn-helix domain-containing protein [bacterium]
MRSLKDWFDYVEKQAKELEKKIKKEAEGKDTSQPSHPEKKEGKGIVFDEIYIGGKEGPKGGGVSFTLPEKVELKGVGEEKVIKGYKRARKESREEFLQRLLDPVLTLRDVARLLNVCPMTVRRYTNKGLLPSFRTAGNQRRFRLSDVLRFMEERGLLKGGEEK